MSVPSAAIHKSAATAAADHPDEPPATLPVPCGLMTGQKNDDSLDDPIAYSSIFAFPITTHPTACSLAKQVALYGATYFSIIREPQLEI